MMIRKFLDKTFLRFVAVGVVNTLFGSGIMFLFYNVFHFGYWISSASNYVFGSILSYFLNKHFTFR
ncbi:MAG: GtrA family protein, partial [Oscillospiraceae bacterium]|nr:GtrA family protein [Oscillospiraceae bacterium]